MKQMNKQRRLVGFQLWDEQGRIPADLHSFEVFTFKGLARYLAQHPQIEKQFQLRPIFKGDVEDLTII